MIDAIARTLRLDQAEREHLYRLADVPQAVEKAYRVALGRRPTDDERQRMTAFILQGSGDGKGAAGLATATADFCQVLLCLNEFLYVD